MARLDETAFLVLHEVRLRGVVQLDESPSVVRLLEVGFVVRSARGVHITTAGRAEHAVWARLGPGTEGAVAARRAYERFLPLNRELVRICSDWQVAPGGVPNDHRDARYDWAVIDRLRTLDERAGPVAARLGRVVPRFGAYRGRLRAAVARVDEGDAEWLTSPRIDSYHTVWMQLHEDLLLAVGTDRSEEPC